MTAEKEVAVIFGGCGFIGAHFCRHLLSNSLVDRVVLVDIKPLREEYLCRFLSPWFEDNSVEYTECDVRNNIESQIGSLKNVSLVVNLAAVHREPGHKLHEYYETNIQGARNVCQWSSHVGCLNLVFTSSIAPYGPTESFKNEQAIPAPITPYGGSKLAAEEIHKTWQAIQPEHNLIIVRPGVVFGPGEGGNVSRLVKAILGRYFIFMGNRDTRKAGVYVKELCCAMSWVLQQTAHSPSITTFNMTMNPAPSMQDYVDIIIKVAGVKRHVPGIPFWLIYPASYLIEAFAKVFNISQPVSPVRIKKLVKSNNIFPGYLENAGYDYQYTLESAMEDWCREAPMDWR